MVWEYLNLLVEYTACNNLKQARATSYQLSDREKMYCLIAEKCLELKLKDAALSAQAASLFLDGCCFVSQHQ